MVGCFSLSFASWEWCFSRSNRRNFILSAAGQSSTWHGGCFLPCMPTVFQESGHGSTLMRRASRAFAPTQFSSQPRDRRAASMWQKKNAARPHPARRGATFRRALGVRVQLPPLFSIIHRCFLKANIYARVQNGVVAGIGCINILCNNPFALGWFFVYGLAGSFNLLI